jgi:hypothetical protein
LVGMGDEVDGTGECCEEWVHERVCKKLQEFAILAEHGPRAPTFFGNRPEHLTGRARCDV